MAAPRGATTPAGGRRQGRSFRFKSKAGWVIARDSSRQKQCYSVTAGVATQLVAGAFFPLTLVSPAVVLSVLCARMCSRLVLECSAAMLTTVAIMLSPRLTGHRVLLASVGC